MAVIESNRKKVCVLCPLTRPLTLCREPQETKCLWFLIPSNRVAHGASKVGETEILKAYSILQTINLQWFCPSHANQSNILSFSSVSGLHRLLREIFGPLTVDYFTMFTKLSLILSTVL